MAEAAGLPYIPVPVTADVMLDAERRLLEVVDEHRADFVGLARYMQVLSDRLCRTLRGRAINIQAYDRGVKLVGATAHYVIPDLDEGPDHRAGGHSDRPHSGSPRIGDRRAWHYAAGVPASRLGRRV